MLHKPRLFVWGVTLLILVARGFYILWGPSDLAVDEAYYWDWSRHLDFCYYSKGPLIAWLIALSTELWGPTEWGVRFFAPLFSAGTGGLIFWMTRRVTGQEEAAAWGVAIFYALPLFAPVGILMTIDAPYLFFATAVIALLMRTLDQPTSARWIVVGFVAGIGFLAKFTTALLPLFMAMAMVVEERWRGLWRTSGPYLAAGIFSLALLPILFWNAQHGWINFQHNASHILELGSNSWRDMLAFVGSQAALVTPPLFLWLLWWSIRSRRTSPLTLLWWLSIPPLLFFLGKSLVGKVEANWADAAWPPLIVAAVGLWHRHGKPWRSFLVIAIAIGAVLSLLIHQTDWIRQMGFSLPVHKDTTKKIRGWRDLADEVRLFIQQSQQSQQSQKEQRPFFLLSDQRTIVAEMAFYLKEESIPVYAIHLEEGIQSQYDLWPDSKSGKHTGWDAVIVHRDGDELSHAIRNDFNSCDKRPITLSSRWHPGWRAEICRFYKRQEE